jgi:1,4-alpha-glucan branching enzyme
LIAEGAYLHQNQIGVILDWVPAHFPGDEAGLGFLDASYLYEHADPKLGQQPEWSTFVIKYGRNGVHNFLISNALFWLDKYHADGLRVAPSRNCRFPAGISRCRVKREEKRRG